MSVAASILPMPHTLALLHMSVVHCTTKDLFAIRLTALSIPTLGGMMQGLLCSGWISSTQEQAHC